MPRHTRLSYAPTGPAFGRPDDRLQRVSSTSSPLDSITETLEYWAPGQAGRRLASRHGPIRQNLRTFKGSAQLNCQYGLSG